VFTKYIISYYEHRINDALSERGRGVKVQDKNVWTTKDGSGCLLLDPECIQKP